MDYVVDSHASVVMVIMIWLFFVANAVSYLAIFEGTVSTKCEENGNSDEFGCQLASVLWSWYVRSRPHERNLVSYAKATDRSFPLSVRSGHCHPA